MQIDVTSDRGTTIVRPRTERLDIEVAAEFRSTLLSLIDEGQRQLVVDLEEVIFIDSSGLGAMVSALKTIKRGGGEGDVRLARVQPPVTSLLEVIRLNRVFNSYPGVNEAIHSFQ
jgi:anti-sigma B factor antagonist